MKGSPHDGHRPQLAHSSATTTACWTDHPRFLHTSPEPSQLSVRPIERRKERRGKEWGGRSASGEGAEHNSNIVKRNAMFLHIRKKNGSREERVECVCGLYAMAKAHERAPPHSREVDFAPRRIGAGYRRHRHLRRHGRRVVALHCPSSAIFARSPPHFWMDAMA